LAYVEVIERYELSEQAFDLILLGESPDAAPVAAVDENAVARRNGQALQGLMGMLDGVQVAGKGARR
jgi:hypothetical protein